MKRQHKLILQEVSDVWYWLIEDDDGTLILAGTRAHPTKDAAESEARAEWRAFTEAQLGVIEK